MAVGCRSGKVEIWDAARGAKVRDAAGHRGRVGCLDWRGGDSERAFLLGVSRRQRGCDVDIS